MGGFMSKCLCFPFLLCFIPGSPSPLQFFLDVGAAMILASSIFLPCLSIRP